MTDRNPAVAATAGAGLLYEPNTWLPAVGFVLVLAGSASTSQRAPVAKAKPPTAESLAVVAQAGPKPIGWRSRGVRLS